MYDIDTGLRTMQCWNINSLIYSFSMEWLENKPRLHLNAILINTNKLKQQMYLLNWIGNNWYINNLQYTM